MRYTIVMAALFLRSSGNFTIGDMVLLASMTIYALIGDFLEMMK